MSLFKERVELKIAEAGFRAGKIFGAFAAWQKWIILSCLLGVVPGYFAAKTLGGRYYSGKYSPYQIEARPSFSEAKNIIIERTDVAALGQNEYSVTVQIINPNLDLAARKISYELKFFGRNGEETAPAENGSFYILPNQRKFLVAPRISSPEGISSVSLILQNAIVWQKKSDLPKVALVTPEPKGKDIADPFGYVLEGSVINSSPYRVKEVRLTFLLYGAGGKIIGSSQRSEFDLEPSERRDYKQIWAGISGRNVIKAETQADTNVLDKTNLKAPAVESGGAGDLDR